jgi:hypothetical protein
VLTNFTALVGGSRVTLDWDDSLESDFDFYTVYTSSSNGGPYSVLASGLTDSFYRENGLPVGSTNYFVVTATDYTGNESNDRLEVAGLIQAPTGEAEIFFVMANGEVYGFDSLDADGDISVAGQEMLTNGIPVFTNAAYGTYQAMLASPEGTIYGVNAAGDVVSWNSLSAWMAGSASNTLSTGLITVGMNGAGYNVASNGFYAIHNQDPYKGDIVEYATLDDFVNGVIDTNLVTAGNFTTIAMTTAYGGSDVDVEYFQVGGTGGLFGYASMAQYKKPSSSFIIPGVVGSGTEIAAGFALLKADLGAIAITIDGSNAIVSWEAKANVSYTLQSRDSDSLVIGDWENSGSVTGAVNGVLSITNSMTSDVEFFQVVVP